MISKKVWIYIIISLCTTSTSFGQNVDDIIATLEIDTLLNNGPKGNRVNFAFANMGNAASGEMLYNNKSELIASVNNILTYFDVNQPHAKSGFAQYRNFFNVQSIWFPDPIMFEQKGEIYLLAQKVRDSLFLPWVDEEHGWVTMLYTGADGNGAGNTREKRVGDIYMHALEWETVLHEFNHTMPGVYDEYTASGSWSNYVCSEGPNVTGKNVLDEVPWRKWIEPGTSIPTPYEDAYFDNIGLFEGNISGYFGCYRPSAKSCYMGAGGFGEDFGQELCPVCLQRFITMLYKYVNVIENPLPASDQIEINGNETISFSADIVKPEPNTQKYEWFLNGKLITTGSESIEIDFDACDKYVVELVVTDTTDAVRYDEKFKDIYPEPKQKHTWYIDQSAVSDYNLSAETSIVPADCNGIANGEIIISATGGLPPYAYSLNGVEQNSSQILNLSAGSYSITISDENGCSVIKEIEIPQETILDFEICSSFLTDSWELSAYILTLNNESLNYLWSNGSRESSIVVSLPGTYNVEISDDDNSCVVVREITLASAANGLVVSHSFGNSVENLNNGAIFLDIRGGLEPYDISWFKDSAIDFTYANASERVISSGNGEFNGHLPVFAFDDDLSFGYDFWAETFTGNNYLGFDFVNATEITNYSITSNVDIKERDGKSWTFQGSDDGINWLDLDRIVNFEFPERLQTFSFNLEEPSTYRFFRLLFTEIWSPNSDGWIAIQQIEIGSSFQDEIEQNKNKKDIQGLASGSYSFLVKDLNQSCEEGSVKIEATDSSDNSITLSVSQEGNYLVKIDESSSLYEYYWSFNNDGSELEHIGAEFQPTEGGQYYVRAFNKETNSFNGEVKGLSINMDSIPEVQIINERLEVVNPKSNHDYIWYDQMLGGESVNTGIEFLPENDGFYYVIARKHREFIEPIDPSEIEGINLWMDASDLDGDGISDNNLVNSSAYSWDFRKGGKWHEDNWFPYRANFQNGNGIVDFSTMWFQYLTTIDVEKTRTIILAYKESSFSFDKSSPFYSLKNYIPKHHNKTQLFSNDTPETTLNGRTFLNGQLVDPLVEDNPMEFMILTVEFSELLNFNPYATDEYWEGKLGEFISWDVTLNDKQLQGVNEFMRKKWLSTADLESPRLKVSWGADHFDDDGDGILNVDDLCPDTSAGEEVNENGCSQSQVDDDNDGVMNDIDTCPDTPIGEEVNETGCVLLASNNFTIETISESCPDKKNGKIIISAQLSYNYIATINGVEYDFISSETLDDLAPGNYEVCIVVKDVTATYCYNLEIKEGTTVSGKSSSTSGKTTIHILEGTAPYEVYVNRKTILRTLSSSFEVETNHGDLIEVKTKVTCEGVFSKTIQLFDIITLYPNPTNGLFELAMPLNLEKVAIEIYNYNSQLISTKTYPVRFGKVQLDLTNKSAGIYLIKILVDKPVTLKIIKE